MKIKIGNTYFINLIFRVLAITPQMYTRADGLSYKQLAVRFLTHKRAKRLKTFLSW